MTLEKILLWEDNLPNPKNKILILSTHFGSLVIHQSLTIAMPVLLFQLSLRKAPNFFSILSVDLEYYIFPFPFGIHLSFLITDPLWCRQPGLLLVVIFQLLQGWNDRVENSRCHTLKIEY